MGRFGANCIWIGRAVCRTFDLTAGPYLRFLIELVEDMADEWQTKVRFHHRWYYKVDQEFTSWWIGSDDLLVNGGEWLSADMALSEALMAFVAPSQDRWIKSSSKPWF